MELVQLRNLTYNHPGQVEHLLENLSASVGRGTAAGLIGKNGSGKTTLLQLICKQLTPVSGEVEYISTGRVAYLPQEVSLEDDLSIFEYLMSGLPELHSLSKKLDRLNHKSPEYARVISDFYDRGGGKLEALMDKTLKGLGMGENKLRVPLTYLSGGEKTKIALARILISEPDLMLLDEPTNHLEIASLMWLETYLKRSRIPFVVVSHDREFLDECVNEIWELKDKSLRCFSGNYSFYRETVNKERDKQQQRYDTQQSEIRKLRSAATERANDARRMEKFKYSRSVTKKGGICKRDDGSGRARANPSRMMKRAKTIERRIERMIEKEEAVKPYVDKRPKVRVPECPETTGFVLRVNSMGKSYGPVAVLNDLAFAVKSGSRLGVIGKNGSGKSTLLKALAGQIEPTSGSYHWSPQTKLGYFSQEHEILNRDATVLDEVLQGRDSETSSARSILGGLRLGSDFVNQKICKLSLGERSKVAIAKLLFSGANVLLLDEPTNHLEVQSREEFENALAEYRGTIIFASHDRYLLRVLATEVLDMETGVFYEGSYNEYLQKANS